MPRSRIKNSKPIPFSIQTEMIGLTDGFWVSQLLYVAASLGIADVLAKGPRTAKDLAEKIGAHAPYLHRILRALASKGVFAEDAKHRFRLTPLAECLLSEKPGALRGRVLMLVDEARWQAWGALLHTVRTGEMVFQHVHGLSTFDYMRMYPEKEKKFAAAMTIISAMQSEAVAKAYPFGKFKRLVDIGGSHGHLLATILRHYPGLEGVLYEMPQVIKAASANDDLKAPELRKRIKLQGGDFFVSVPEGADAYIMKYIIHDWDDEYCIRILRNCRKAMAKNGRVLIVEQVIKPGNAPGRAKLSDINMMVETGGQERTSEEFKNLLSRAGLRLIRIIPTTSTMSIIDARTA